jgi:hypothetical protein
VVHAVRHLLHAPVELESWPEGDRTSRLVFITSGDLGREPIEALFRAVLALAPP